MAVRKKMKKKKKLNWEERIKAAKVDFTNYSFRSIFNEGDYIEHSKFGKGYVESSAGNKIEVMFEDKVRLLVHSVA